MHSTFHLVCGSTGAGKTTFAREIASGEAAVLFSIDEWMVGLFGADAPPSLNPAWIGPRVTRCEDRIAKTALDITVVGTSCVLDLGFQKRSHRERWASLAAAAGIAVKVHVLDVSATERWRRVEARNNDQSAMYALKVTRPMFDYIETTWEPPSPSEIIRLEAPPTG